MSTIDDLLNQLPIDQIASRLGVDPKTAQTAVEHALPALLGGLHANAQNPGSAAALGNALSNHDPNLLDNGVDLDQVDTKDGSKIVGHVFGGTQGQVASQLGGVSGLSSGLIAKLLPMLAPIVMAYLAKQFFGGHGSGSKAASTGTNLAPADDSGSGGGLTDILGGMLGGGGAGGRAGGLDLGSILGSLGGLLGGGTRA
jgi:hypothetical protein